MLILQITQIKINKTKMELNDINDQLRLKNMEFSIEKDYKKKQDIRDQIQTLQFKKQIAIIKDKIKRISK